MHPDAWSLSDHLLAGIFDTLSWANFQRAGGRGKKPKPLKRPGQHDPSEKRYGTPVSVDEFHRIWGRGDDG